MAPKKEKAPPPSSKPAMSGGGKQKKKKWSKGKQKENVNNAMLFDQASYDKMVAEVPKFKQITPSVLSERHRVYPLMRKRAKGKLELPLHVVVYEILTRLPVKTVSRFRCVSKTWNCLISQPRFEKEHHQRAQQNPLLLTMQSIQESPFVSFSTFSEDGGSCHKHFSKIFTQTISAYSRNSVVFTPIQSCRGLVCMKSYGDGSISVFNPSTEEIITLPLAIDQFCDIWAGFGYAASTKEFKAVRFFDCIEDTSKLGCEVFTLGSSNSWRQARSNPPFSPDTCVHIPFLHGALHFLPAREHYDILDDHYIAAFDVDSEEYKKVPLPQIYFEERSLGDTCYLAGDRGSLCVIFDWFFSKKILQLWVLKDYDSGNWVKGYNIDLPAEYRLTRCSLDMPITFTRDAKILLHLIKNDVIPECCYYSIQEKRVVKTLGRICFGLFYTESFWPLGSR